MNDTQEKQILKHLETHVGITSIEATEKYGITRLSARVKDLRNKGVDIKTVMKDGVTRLGHKCRYGQYRLTKKTEETA